MLDVTVRKAGQFPTNSRFDPISRLYLAHLRCQASLLARKSSLQRHNDVGRTQEPEKHRYDHHQSSASSCNHRDLFGIPFYRSSRGLFSAASIWRVRPHFSALHRINTDLASKVSFEKRLLSLKMHSLPTDSSHGHTKLEW